MKRYTHHAIVTDIDEDKKVYKVIHFTGFTKQTASLREASMVLSNHHGVLLVNSNIRIDSIPEFKLLPPQASVEIAKYLMKTPGEWQSYHVWNNNCEHFVYYCTFGYAVSFQKIQSFMRSRFAFRKQKTIDFDELLTKIFNTDKVVEYNEGDSYVTITLQNGCAVKIEFKN